MDTRVMQFVTHIVDDSHSSWRLTYSQLQIGLHSILRFFPKTFDLVPGDQDSHVIDHLLLGTNPKSHGQNSGSLKKF